MAYFENKRLYDISTRIQLYTEGVKANSARQFAGVMLQLREELRKILSRTTYKSLDGMTKTELNRLIVSIRKTQTNIYNNYSNQVLSMLEAFMNASLTVNRRAYISAYTGETQTDAFAIAWLAQNVTASSLIPLYGLAAVTDNPSRLWANIKNEPIPANGAFVLPFLKTFSNSAQAGVENLIRKAWANGWTLEETIEALTGSANVPDKQGTSSQLQRIGVQAAAVTATLIAHVAAIVSTAVTSAVAKLYEWVSIIDGHTTWICRERDGARYQYGKGPLPPAHIRCRSHITPIVGNDELPDESFYEWIKRQPTSVQNDVLGNRAAIALRTGKLRKKDLEKYVAQPLTIAEFKGKINEILLTR